MNNWINVNYALPGTGMNVLISSSKFDDVMVGCCVYTGAGENLEWRLATDVSKGVHLADTKNIDGYDGLGVTHWMPIAAKIEVIDEKSKSYSPCKLRITLELNKDSTVEVNFDSIETEHLRFGDAMDLLDFGRDRLIHQSFGDRK